VIIAIHAAGEFSFARTDYGGVRASG